MAGASDTEDLPHSDNFHSQNVDEIGLDELREKFSELSGLSQQLITEKLFLENECTQLKKRVSRLDEDIRNLKSPPLIIGHIQDIIGNHAIVRSSNGTVFQVSVNSRLNSDLLKPGARVSLNQDNLSIIDVLSDSWDPLVSTSEVINKPTITYDDVGGMSEQIKKLKQSIELPLTNPLAFKDMGLEPPKGVLLSGPPGTGKTMLAKAVANATDATFLGIVGSELAQKYIGEGGRLVRELFDLAREKAPSIIFIDEIDAIGSKRMDTSTSGDREVQRTLMQLLAELDGFESLENVKVIAATNRPELLDKALLRPGRFDRIIDVGLPDLNGRKHILEIMTKDVNVSLSVNLDNLAKKSEGFSGAEIKALILESGMLAIDDKSKQITNSHFESGLKKIHENRSDPIFGDPSGLYG